MMPVSQSIRLMIVEDQPIIRRALAQLVEAAPGFEVVAQAGDGVEAIRLARLHEPDVILMDIQMPRLGGIAATEQILRDGSQARIIMLTTYDSSDLVSGAVLAGAQAYLLKDAEEETILSTIRGVAAGEARFSPGVAGKILEEFRRSRATTLAATVDESNEALTGRETDILTLLMAGKGNRDIALALQLAEGTVKNHVSRILSKLHARSRTELVARKLARSPG